MYAGLLLLLNFSTLSWSLMVMRQVRERLLIDTAAEVERAQMPFMAFIIGDDDMACSGSIPSLTTVLTTAQCIIGDKRMKAWAGTNRLRLRQDFNPPTQYRWVDKIGVPDPDFVEIDDIGIAFLQKPWDETEYVKPIQLWIQNRILSLDYIADLQVIGWGFANQTGMDRQLRQTVMSIGSSILCPTTALQHLRQIMCSMDVLQKTICKGDNGGAVIMEFPVVGLVQLGVIKSQEPIERRKRRQNPAPDKNIKDESCKVPALANLFMYTAYYRTWILKTIPDLPSLDVNWPTPNFTRPLEIHTMKKCETFRGKASMVMMASPVVLLNAFFHFLMSWKL